MNQLLKLSYEQISGQQMVDLRSQKEYQRGHLQGALNLTPRNLLKYGKHFLSKNQEIILIVAKENFQELPALVEEAEAAGIENISAYLLAEDIPESNLEKIQTIPAADFMALEGDYRLLDLRHPDEITRPAPEKHLVNIPIEELPENYSQLDLNLNVYTLCGSGGRATAAASYLKKQGYQPIVIEGGMGAVEAFNKGL